MCEFCGCETVRSVEHPLQQRQPKGKTLGVRVKSAPAEPKSTPPVTTALREKPRSAHEDLTAEHV